MSRYSDIQSDTTERRTAEELSAQFVHQNQQYHDTPIGKLNFENLLCCGDLHHGNSRALPNCVAGLLGEFTAKCIAEQGIDTSRTMQRKLTTSNDFMKRSLKEAATRNGHQTVAGQVASMIQTHRCADRQASPPVFRGALLD